MKRILSLIISVMMMAAVVTVPAEIYAVEEEKGQTAAPAAEEKSEQASETAGAVVPETEGTETEGPGTEAEAKPESTAEAEAVPALAQNGEETELLTPIKSQSATQINPLHEGEIDESDLVQERTLPSLNASSKSVPKASVLDNNGASYTTSLSSLAARLRDQMEARKQKVTLYYKTRSASNALFQDIFNAALIHTGVPTEGDYLQWNWYGWKASLSGYYDSQHNYYLTITYTITYYTTAAQETAVSTKVDQALASMNLSGKSDYTKTKAIYDYICKNVKYDYSTSSLKYSAYSALIKKKAVCQGYALLFYRMALEAGLDARFIPGYAGEDHGWNIVKIGDVYYNLDATWDATNKQNGYAYRYFLKCPDTFDRDHLRWSNWDTTAFHRVYPMAEENFRPGVSEDSVTKVPNLAAPKTVTTTLYGYDDLKVSWSKVSGATGYYVYYKRSTAKSYTLLGVTANTSYKKANLADGAAYSFRIYPYVKMNGVKNRDSSYKTASAVYTLKKVGTPTAKKYSRYYVRIGWTNIPGESGYQIARSTRKSSGFKVVKTVNYKYKTTTIKTNRNRYYYYKIRAYKTVNGKKIYGPWSAVRSYKLK